MRPRFHVSRPSIAQLPSTATVSVCTAASSVPNRALTTPVARNSWKVSAGMRNRSSRNGTAAFRLPKKVTSPDAASAGSASRARTTSANQPANSTKLIDSSLPLCGKLNDAGTMTSGSVGRRGAGQRAARCSVLLASISDGRTMKRSPATNAVSSGVACRCGALAVSGMGVSAATRPGSTQSAQQQRHGHVGQQVDLQAGELLELSVPAAVAAIANMPYGRQPATKRRRPRQCIAPRLSTSSSALLALDADQRHAERRTENSTTAGTMLLASELNGLDGM